MITVARSSGSHVLNPPLVCALRERRVATIRRGGALWTLRKALRPSRSRLIHACPVPPPPPPHTQHHSILRGLDAHCAPTQAVGERPASFGVPGVVEHCFVGGEVLKIAFSREFSGTYLVSSIIAFSPRSS